MTTVFMCIAGLIWLITRKNLAFMSASIFFFSWMLEQNHTMEYQESVLSIIILNLAMFTTAAIEYKSCHSSLSRSIMWISFAALLLSVTLTVGLYQWQNNLFIMLSITEIISLIMFDGQRRMVHDVAICFIDSLRSVRHGLRRHTHHKG